MADAPVEGNKSAAPPKCAVCGRPRVAEYAPFCSKRCADVDLGRWLKGVHAIPAGPVPDEDGEESEE
jgi:endogenous inhibitor of DNA gyrase (YacG/DUF329 family)